MKTINVLKKILVIAKVKIVLALVKTNNLRRRSGLAYFYAKYIIDNIKNILQKIFCCVSLSKSSDRWPSGRRRTIGNRVYP